MNPQKKDAGGRKSEQHPNHPQPKPSPVQSQQFLWKAVKESMTESFAPSVDQDSGMQTRRRSHPPMRCRDLVTLSEADQATRAVSTLLLELHLGIKWQD